MLGILFRVEEHRRFWSIHPAVLIGISFLIGIGFALFSLPPWICVGWMAYLFPLRKWAACLMVPSAALYAWLLFGAILPLENPKQVNGYFSIHSVLPNKTPFAQNIIYRGTLFINQVPYPCSISAGAKRELAHCDYRVSGMLTQRGPYDYLLKAKTWEKVPNTWSLAELRFQAKSHVKKWIHSKLTRPRTATLLTSLVTGEVGDRLLRYEFARLGLQHILAISGFHFGVLIAFLALLLKFLSRRIQWLAMILLTTTYYLFIGDSPAVQRAWIIVTLFLIAKLIGKPTTPINLLGTALLIELIYNPLVAANLAFQFSFGSCFGILLLYRPIEQALRRFLPASDSARLPPLQGLIRLFCNAMRCTIALTTSVNIAILPLVFLHFGKFPLLGLIYNLFFPFFIGLALFFLLAALLFSCLSFTLSKPLFSILDYYTAQLLDLVSYPPLLLDYSIYVRTVPPLFIPLYFFALICIAIYLSAKMREDYFSLA